MTALKFDRFNGLLPRVPASLLPANHASEAQNCDFAYGELRATRLEFFIRNLANEVKSIYTDNGLLFYSWPEDINAVRSPLANDEFNRLYFTSASDFRVTSRAGMSINGGAPASSYRVGVPRPSLAPVLAASTVSPLLGSSISAVFHYELGGIKYQEQAISLITQTAFEKWNFTPPAKAYTAPSRNPQTNEYPPPLAQETPAQAFPVLRLVAKRPDNSIAADIYSNDSALNTESAWQLSLAKVGSANDYSVAFAASSNEANKESKAYVYTYANIYNEEGPASAPTIISANMLLAVSLTVQRDAQTADYAPIKEIRLYRTPSGSEIADYFFVGAIPVLGQEGLNFAFNDNIAASGLNEALASTSYYPPNPLLVGLLSLQNGILMAWKGNEVHFSDAYKPWSWPPEYVLTFGDASVTGAIALGAGVLVTTSGRPVLVSGIAPDAMTQSTLGAQQAGVSKWSLADIGGMVIYASHDGLIALEGGQPGLQFSNRFFTHDVWRTRYANGLDTMRFTVWDGRLIVYSSAQAFVPFMISLDEARGEMTDLPALVASCSFISPLVDQCYFARGTGLYQFAGGLDASALWTSRELVVNRPGNFAVMQVVCSGTWSVKLWADGVLRHTQNNITSNLTFRLPGGFLAERWQFTLQGQGVLREVRIADSVSALAQI